MVQRQIQNPALAIEAFDLSIPERGDDLESDFLRLCPPLSVILSLVLLQPILTVGTW